MIWTCLAPAFWGRIRLVPLFVSCKAASAKSSILSILGNRPERVVLYSLPIRTSASYRAWVLVLCYFSQNNVFLSAYFEENSQPSLDMNSTLLQPSSKLWIFMKTRGTVKNEGQIQCVKNMSGGYSNPVWCQYWCCSGELRYQGQERWNTVTKEEKK